MEAQQQLQAQQNINHHEKIITEIKRLVDTGLQCHVSNLDAATQADQAKHLEFIQKNMSFIRPNLPLSLLQAIEIDYYHHIIVLISYDLTTHTYITEAIKERYLRLIVNNPELPPTFFLAAAQVLCEHDLNGEAMACLGHAHQSANTQEHTGLLHNCHRALNQMNATQLANIAHTVLATQWEYRFAGSLQQLNDHRLSRDTRIQARQTLLDALQPLAHTLVAAEAYTALHAILNIPLCMQHHAIHTARVQVPLRYCDPELNTYDISIQQANNEKEEQAILIQCFDSNRAPNISLNQRLCLLYVNNSWELYRWQVHLHTWQHFVPDSNPLWHTLSQTLKQADQNPIKYQTAMDIAKTLKQQAALALAVDEYRQQWQCTDSIDYKRDFLIIKLNQQHRYLICGWHDHNNQLHWQWLDTFDHLGETLAAAIAAQGTHTSLQPKALAHFLKIRPHWKKAYTLRQLIDAQIVDLKQAYLETLGRADFDIHGQQYLDALQHLLTYCLLYQLKEPIQALCDALNDVSPQDDKRARQTIIANTLEVMNYVSQSTFTSQEQSCQQIPSLNPYIQRSQQLKQIRQAMPPFWLATVEKLKQFRQEISQNNKAYYPEQYIAIIRQFLQAITEQFAVYFGSPPCDLDFLISGSVARGDPGPFSDVEGSIYAHQDDAAHPYPQALYHYIKHCFSALQEPGRTHCDQLKAGDAPRYLNWLPLGLHLDPKVGPSNQAASYEIVCNTTFTTAKWLTWSESTVPNKIAYQLLCSTVIPLYRLPPGHQTNIIPLNTDTTTQAPLQPSATTSKISLQPLGTRAQGYLQPHSAHTQIPLTSETSPANYHAELTISQAFQAAQAEGKWAECYAKKMIEEHSQDYFSRLSPPQPGGELSLKDYLASLNYWIFDLTLWLHSQGHYKRHQDNTPYQTIIRKNPLELLTDLLELKVISQDWAYLLTTSIEYLQRLRWQSQQVAGLQPPKDAVALPGFAGTTKTFDRLTLNEMQAERLQHIFNLIRTAYGCFQHDGTHDFFPGAQLDPPQYYFRTLKNIWDNIAEKHTLISAYQTALRALWYSLEQCQYNHSELQKHIPYWLAFIDAHPDLTQLKLPNSVAWHLYINYLRTRNLSRYQQLIEHNLLIANRSAEQITDTLDTFNNRLWNEHPKLSLQYRGGQ